MREEREEWDLHIISLRNVQNCLSNSAWNTDTNRDRASKRIEDMVSLDETIHKGSNDTVLVGSDTIFSQLDEKNYQKIERMSS